MEQKINIAELLKDCPKGMELDCLMYDNVSLMKVDDDKDAIYPIRVFRSNGCLIDFTKYGQYSNMNDAKCVIFPKGKTTWEGFVPPCKFKDGDILATEEEKQKLFQAIKDNGYKWNAETKTLEKLVEPKFKVGDKIQDEDGYKVKITEINIDDECYEYESMLAKGIGGIAFSEQDNWELVPDKFDITTLVPFESRVLVRDSIDGVEEFDGECETVWRPAVWGVHVKDNAYPFGVVGGCYFRYCIPYEGNEHLLSTTDDCDEYYKVWK